MSWHREKVEDVVEQFRSSSQGLSFEEAKQRLDEYGLNELVEKKKNILYIK